MTNVEGLVNFLENRTFLVADSRIALQTGAENNREVVTLDTDVYDIPGVDEGIVVAKFGNEYQDVETNVYGNPVDAFPQNKTELRNYLESLERGSDLFPEIIGGRSDLSVIFVRYNTPFEWNRDDLKKHEDWEDWKDHDRGSTEFGIREGKLIPLDHGGVTPKDGYRFIDEIDGSLDENPGLETVGISGQYFETS